LFESFVKAEGYKAKIMHISGYLFSFKDDLHTLFGWKDEQKKGRTCMVGSSILGTIISSMTTGIFYTGFLLGNNIDISGIGIITFIPYLATLVSLFAPSLYDHFPRRRRILAVLRAAQWIINLLGTTLLPHFVSDPTARIVWFCLISFFSSAIGGLCTAGFTPWHINFIPEEVRAPYWLYSSLFTNLISGLFLILSSIAADLVSGSPNEMTIIVSLRYVALALAMFEVFILTRPKEYPYAQTEAHPSPKQVFSLPLRDRAFCSTEIIQLLYAVFTYLSSSVITAYLLSTVGVTYTMINAINLLYVLILLLFSPFWRRRIVRRGWLVTLSQTLLLLAPTYFLYMFINSSNYLILFPLMRLVQHFICVGHETCISNLLYLKMPKENQSCFVSFHNIVYNTTVLLSMMAGTYFVSQMGDRVLTLGSFSFGSVPLLLGTTGLGYIALSFFVRRRAASLDPLH
jgi:hypothetical protein